MHRETVKHHKAIYILSLSSLICILSSCMSVPSAKEVLHNRDFRANTFSLEMITERYGKQKTQTVVLFSIEPGYDAMVCNSLKSRSDIEGAVRYTDIMAMQYQHDRRARCYLNISLLYYLIGDRDNLDKYYRLADGLDFSDETRRTFKKMLIIYPDY